MPWFKVDDGFASCRPVLAIPRRYRAQAVGLWLMAGTWSARELTDGFIPEYLLDELASTPAMAAHLVRAGLFEEASGGYQLIGWAKYQPTKEQVYARRSEEAQRKQRAREARRKQSDQQEPESVRNVSHPDPVRSPQRVRPVSEHPDPTRPAPTRPLLSVVTSEEEVALVDAQEPPAKCPAHINDPSPPPCRACGDCRRHHDAWKAARDLRRRELAEQRRALIDHCNDCDHNGMVDVGSGLSRCTHTSDDMAEVPF